MCNYIYFQKIVHFFQVFKFVGRKLFIISYCDFKKSLLVTMQFCSLCLDESGSMFLLLSCFKGLAFVFIDLYYLHSIPCLGLHYCFFFQAFKLSHQSTNMGLFFLLFNTYLKAVNFPLDTTFNKYQSTYTSILNIF